MLSRAQPVTATDPARGVESPVGVSIVPKGGDTAAVAGTSVNATTIGPAVSVVPVREREMVPVTVPDRGRLGSNFIATVNGVDNEPDAGVTVSHGVSGVAVHVAPAIEFRIRRTICAGVCDVSAVPVFTAARLTLARVRPGSTTTGRTRLEVVPSPSCPLVFRPQHMVTPPLLCAQL
jgi:hypothetical protein